MVKSIRNSGGQQVLVLSTCWTFSEKSKPPKLLFNIDWGNKKTKTIPDLYV